MKTGNDIAQYEYDTPEEEFVLSDKEDNFFNMDYDDKLYYRKDVKEFIRLLKEDFENEYGKKESARMKGIITERAGDKLI